MAGQITLLNIYVILWHVVIKAGVALWILQSNKALQGILDCTLHCYMI